MRARAEVKAVECLWDVARGGQVVREYVDGRGNLVIERARPKAQPRMFPLERSLVATVG